MLQQILDAFIFQTLTSQHATPDVLGHAANAADQCRDGPLAAGRDCLVSVEIAEEARDRRIAAAAQ
jgi:hypothetical protein